MEFIPAIDDPEIAQTNILISKNNFVRIGIFKVAFGYRVRAGFVSDEYGCQIDWCAGNSWENVEKLYRLAIAILQKRHEDYNCFQGIPTVSKVKPFFKDKEFTELIVNLAKE